MPEVNDMALIRQYADRGSESAFTDLVHRHIHLVYSVAFRYVGNSPDAQDVTQAVFIILAKKAPSLRHRATLTGWLYETTRYTAAALLRSRVRHQARDQEAYMQSTLNDSDPNDVWRQLAPILEDAMNRLNEKERALLALRFFDNKTAAETAVLLGIREGAAHKRAARALEKLRRFFLKRGIDSTTEIIAGAISANSVQAAPVALAKSVTAVAMAKGAAASGTTLILVKGTVKTMTWLKTTTLAVILTNALLSQEIVATHFDLAGHPDYWMTRSHSTLVSLLVGCGFPLYFLAMGYLVRFLPINAHTFKIPNRDYWLAPERRGELFDYLFHHSLWLTCFAAIFMLTILLLMVQANHQTPPRFSTPLALIAGGCFIVATAGWTGIMLRHFKRVPPTP
jgi:RNA polymerase sigma factor (sigma-70 family)